MTGNAPSAARLRHAEAIDAPRIDALAFRQGWRVVTRLDGLLAAGLIAPGVWQAAAEYRAAWESWPRRPRRAADRAPLATVPLPTPAGSMRARSRGGAIRAAESAISPGHAALCHALLAPSRPVLAQSLGARLGRP